MDCHPVTNIYLLFQIQKQFRHLPKNDRDNRDNDFVDFGRPVTRD